MWHDLRRMTAVVSKEQKPRSASEGRRAGGVQSEEGPGFATLRAEVKVPGRLLSATYGDDGGSWCVLPDDS